MYIACNDTSVKMINFRKSKTHAITDTFCIWVAFIILHHKKVTASKQKLVKSALLPHTQRARERVKYK